MGEVFDKVHEEGLGTDRDIRIGKCSISFGCLKGLMARLGFSEQEVLDILDVPETERLRYLATLWQHPTKPKMCDVFKEVWLGGYLIGFKEGYEEAVADKRMLHYVRCVMANAGLSAQEAMDALSVPEENRPRYLEMLRA